MNTSLIRLLFSLLFLITCSRAQEPCLRPLNCFVDPCRSAQCDAFPLATCTPNYCSGCNTNWTLNGEPVNCTCNPVNCLVDPCTSAKCDAYPLASCIANYCGGCNTKWTILGKPVDCSCKPVSCLVDPCQGKTCPAYPNATCTADYCGGCNTVWSVDGVPVDCLDPSITPTVKVCNLMCVIGKKCVVGPNGPECVTAEPPPTSCAAVRCAFGRVCVELNGAPTCVPSSGKPGQCPVVRAGEVGICLEGCSSDLECPGSEKCCRGACGSSCKAPVNGPTKPGTCPVVTRSLVDTYFSPVCTSECASDSDCPDINKCCADGCNSVCLRPADAPCDSCSSAIRPLSPLRLCADGTRSEGYKCNLRTCSWEFVPCPSCNCAIPSSPLVNCSLNCPGEGKCQLVGGVCAPSWSCQSCLNVPPPPTTPKCIRAGCQGEKCVKEGDPITLECAFPSLRFKCLDAARCEVNSSTGSCEWNYTKAYNECLNGGKLDDPICTTRDPCLCTSNPKCGYCLSSVTLATGISTPVGRCIPTDKSDKCVAALALGGYRGQYFPQFNCPTVSTPTTKFLNKLNSISLADVQEKLVNIIKSDQTLSDVSCHVQTLLEAVLDTTDGNVITRAILEVTATTSEKLDKLCHVVGSTLATKPIACKLTKILTPPPPSSSATPGPVKRGIAQTGPDTYLFEAKVANTDPDAATSPTVELPPYGVALIVICALVIVVIVVVVLYKVMDNPEQY